MSKSVSRLAKRLKVTATDDQMLDSVDGAVQVKTHDSDVEEVVLDYGAEPFPATQPANSNSVVDERLAFVDSDDEDEKDYSFVSSTATQQAVRSIVTSTVDDDSMQDSIDDDDGAVRTKSHDSDFDEDEDDIPLSAVVAAAAAAAPNTNPPSTPLQCAICLQRDFADAAALAAHHSDHRLRHECEHCHRELFGALQIAYHRRTEHTKQTQSRAANDDDGADDAPPKRPRKNAANRLPVCRHCEPPLPEFATLRRLDGHKRLAHPDRWVAVACKLCERRFDTRARLNQHQYVEHPEARLCAACDICGLLVTSAASLEAALLVHRATHGRPRSTPHLCPVCGKSCRRRADLADHMNTHTGERPYACTECAATFTGKRWLEQHQLVHSGERPWKCAHCDRRYAHFTDRRRHQRTHAEHVEEMRFECRPCGQKFWENKFLVKHQQRCGAAAAGKEG